MTLLTRKKVGLLHGAADVDVNIDVNVNALAVSGGTSVHPYKESGNFATLSCREGVSELSGEGFENFGEEFRTVLGCSGRDVVAVEPCYFVHTHSLEYERLEVAVDKRLDYG